MALQDTEQSRLATATIADQGDSVFSFEHCSEALDVELVGTWHVRAFCDDLRAFSVKAGKG
jgi:hypothetical protein